MFVPEFGAFTAAILIAASWSRVAMRSVLRQELAALPGVTWVVGNSHKQHVGEIVSKGTFVPLAALAARPSVNPAAESDNGSCLEIVVGDIFAHTELEAAPVFGAGAERTRPNLKVQDGCDNRCSFCIIPSVRGQSRSLKLEAVLREVHALVAAGYREVVISGINLGRWGRDLDGAAGAHFEHLVRAILEYTDVEKLRISSVEPMDWSEELIRLMADSSRIARHAHVPMQSGSDSVLRRMHRKYRPWHYAEKVRRIREAIPEAAIGADVMVGFPGESEHEFAETRAMVEELPFTYLHVFTYSSRPGTPAADMARQIAPGMARQRNRLLRELAVGKKRQFMESFVGRELPAITLSGQGTDRTDALTDNYLKLRLRGHHEPNQWVKARIEAADGDSLAGSLVESPLPISL